MITRLLAIGVLVAACCGAGCARRKPAAHAEAEVAPPRAEESAPALRDARPAIEHWVAYDASTGTCGRRARRRPAAPMSSWGPDIDPFAERVARDAWVVDEAPEPICRRTVTIGRGYLGPEGAWTDADPKPPRPRAR